MTCPCRLISVSAYNTAKSSENKIHDDAIAQRFGFRGGLVGGVHVYAYMTHLPVQHWGRAWLERGTGEARFGKPVYEGDIAEITAEEDADGTGVEGAKRRRAVRHRPCRVAGRRAGDARSTTSAPSPRAQPVRPPTSNPCASATGSA